MNDFEARYECGGFLRKNKEWGLISTHYYYYYYFPTVMREKD